MINFFIVLLVIVWLTWLIFKIEKKREEARINMANILTKIIVEFLNVRELLTGEKKESTKKCQTKKKEPN